jgi:hypothetical protein
MDHDYGEEENACIEMGSRIMRRIKSFLDLMEEVA